MSQEHGHLPPRHSLARIVGLAGVIATMWWGSQARGALPLIDTFEPDGVLGSVWKLWPEADERLFTSSAHNHTAPGTYAAMAVEADPWGYASYADFGATTGDVRAEVWVYDPLDDSGLDPDRPISCMLALMGGTPGVDTFDYTEYLQLGVIAWYTSGLSRTYAIRTKHRDDANGGFVDTGIPRKTGWTKLTIAAGSLASGGQVRFYIDDQPVGWSFRSAAPLQFVRLGVNFKSYDFFWYDDVSVTANPPVNDVRFDADGDADVDMDDFAVLQACVGRPSGQTPGCVRMDADDNGKINLIDVTAFVACGSGAGVAADPACDGPSPP